MNKILLEVYLPLLEQSYEIFVPTHNKIQNIIDLTIKAVEEMLDDNTFTTDNRVLCNKKDGRIYDNNMTIRESGLENGSQIILI